jgi:hypothetical protein
MTNLDPAVLAAEFEREMQMVGGAPGRVCIPEGLCLRVLTVLRAQPAPAMVEARPVAWLHTRHMELDQTQTEVTECAKHPFGRPGRDFSEEYRVTSEPLYPVATLSTKPSPSPATPEKQGGGMG